VKEEDVFDLSSVTTGPVHDCPLAAIPTAFSASVSISKVQLAEDKTAKITLKLASYHREFLL